MRRTLRVLVAVALGIWQADACAFAHSGLDPPNDGIHRPLGYTRRLKSLGDALKGSAPLMPEPLDMSNNGFVSHSLLQRAPMTGSKTLIETLLAHQAKLKEDLCYFSFQPLPPPPGGPTLLHPFRKYWDVSDGSQDQDIEWVQSLGEVAIARLRSMSIDGGVGGPVAGGFCSIGRDLMKRRCDNGRSVKEKCVPGLLGQDLKWPMAIAIFNISEQLPATILNWRGNGSLHEPNIAWTTHTGSGGSYPWNGGGPVGAPGDVDPEGMPHGPAWPVSKTIAWGGMGLGSAMIAKVVPCQQIPKAYLYQPQAAECDRLEDGTNTSTADASYAVWKSLTSVWPPTSPCKDDVPALRKVLRGLDPSLANVSSCKEAKAKLTAPVPDICNLPTTAPLFRDVCCSVCGNQPIPGVAPAPAPAPPAPKGGWSCSLCQHVYDPMKDDSQGRPFAKLPATWKCPVCGAPKSAYKQNSAGEWVHTPESVIV